VLVIVAIIAIIIVIIFLSSQDSLSEIIRFSDENLEIVVREILNEHNRDLTRGDLINITELHASDRGIRYVSDLQYMRELRIVDLGNNNIRDLYGLHYLLHLEELHLNGNRIDNLDEIVEALGNLEILDLSSNDLIDASQLNGRNNLTTLILDNIGIYDASILQNLPSLTKLSLNNNHIGNIEALQQFSSLTILRLDNAGIDDISILYNFPNLTELSLNDNNITIIEVLRQLPELTILRLDNNRISRYDGPRCNNHRQLISEQPLLALNNLKLLSLKNTGIINTYVLREMNLQSLERMYLCSNPIRNTPHREAHMRALRNRAGCSDDENRKIITQAECTYCRR